MAMFRPLYSNHAPEQQPPAFTHSDAVAASSSYRQAIILYLPRVLRTKSVREHSPIRYLARSSPALSPPV